MEIIKETKAINELTNVEIERMFQLMKPYYIDPTSLLERDLKHNTNIYLLKDDIDNLLSFFMVGWEKHFIDDKLSSVVFLGLSCANQKFQERKFASKVYYYFTKDAFDYEQLNNEKLILYGTTATPVVLLTLSKIWDNVKPLQDGSYTEYDKIIIDAIKKSTGLDKYSSDHPFVLKRIAIKTKYSVNEEARLKEVEIKNNIKIFEKLNIDEANGDRLLITCNIPNKSKLDILKSKLVD